MRKLKRLLKWLLRSLLACIILLIVATAWEVETPSLSLRAASSDTQRFQVLDRNGKPLGITYKNRFNTMDIVPLHQMPDLLKQSFVTSEDKQFFTHHGVDWKARLGALRQNILARKSVRGASTITEQVVRIVHPRRRNLWSRWVEGFEAPLLEMRASKGEILAFYLNQVPYAANRRGIAQASRYYFSRDLDTLTHKEMLALAILPRAPSALDLYKNPDAIEVAIARLATSMQQRGEISTAEHAKLLRDAITLEPPTPQLGATHFINYIRETVPYRLSDNGVLLTTLDGELQRRAQGMLDERLKSLKRKRVHNGAVLVVDNATGEILVWAVGGAGSPGTPGSDIDSVRAARQPGSALKPFLYALALDSGWSPATELDDAPMAEAIGTGLHDFHNYSRTFYGKISLREALGNSLNIPALVTIGFVTPSRYLDILHAIGFESLTQPVEFYKEGLALGTGEVTLFEMVQAYNTLANRGNFRALTPLPQPPMTRETTKIYTPEAASLIGNILSDPYARRREFGAGSVLNLPVQTAVKTGTSTDYRDAWVMGYNSRYTVGIWLGNLDQSPMDGVTGSTGPALILRGIFAALNEKGTPRGLYLSPKLVSQEVCTNYDSKPDAACFPRTEYFIPGTEPKPVAKIEATTIRLVRPTQGLQIAYDPRIPANVQAFDFVADGMQRNTTMEWKLDGARLGTSTDGHYLWPVSRGRHTLEIHELDADKKILSSDKVSFNVK
ncbi:MAG: transglycosylase domain-containing protein [Rickettsiales bacterium]